MQVEKVKGIKPGFSDSTGPYESIRLGLNIDGYFVDFGNFYFGSYMDDSHAELFEKLEKFIDECVSRFESVDEFEPVKG